MGNDVFYLSKISTDELVGKLNNSDVLWWDPDVLIELQSRAGDEGELPANCLAEMPLEIVDSWLYDLGYVADDAGTYRKRSPLTDDEVDAWLLNKEV